MLERSVPLVSLRKALVPPWFKEMEPRYRDSRVARNSALSTRYLAAFAAATAETTAGGQDEGGANQRRQASPHPQGG